MIDLVFWSCVLGFSPIVLAIGSRIIAIVAGSSRRELAQPPAFPREGRITPHLGPRLIARAGGFIHGR